MNRHMALSAADGKLRRKSMALPILSPQFSSPGYFTILGIFEIIWSSVSAPFTKL